MAKKINKRILEILKNDARLWVDKEFNQTKLIDLVEKYDETIINTLFSDENFKKQFFIKVNKAWVFKVRDFVFFMEENKVNNSYTDYKNRIGLTDGKRFLKDTKDVVLDFPFKDCVLEGGQSSDEGMDEFYQYDEKVSKADEKKGHKANQYNLKHAKRKEVFFNQVLAKDEIDRLTDPKALTSAKKYTKDGTSDKINFERDENGTIKDNLIIKGNNLLALHSLKSNFAGKVKLIYIDPPYNTGNDSFNYNDNFNHSTWLTFMKNRLEVARDLLSDDGVIFVQCDDNEQAYLKVLMDEIFGQENFINIISAKMKNIAGASGGGEDKRLKKNIEFLNIFAKNYNSSKLKNSYKYTEIYKLVRLYKLEKISWKYTSIIINFGEKEYLKSTKDGDGNEIKIYKRINPVFKSISQVIKESGLPVEKIYYKYMDNIFTTAMPQSSIRTRILKSIENVDYDFISIEYVPRSGKNKGKIYEQFYKGEKLRLLTWLKDVVEEKNKKYYKKDLQGTFWDGFNLNNLSKEGDTVFESGKKPEELVKKVLDISTKKGDIVLDYHLGSGTTCAVAHKMGRQYIGIEQMDYIEDIAVKRMQKVIKGEQGGISKSIDWQGGGEFVYVELAKWNEAAKDKINACKKLDALIKLFDELYSQYFLNYNLKIKEFKEKVTLEDNFKNLDLDKQKQIFLTMLDLNQMYVNKSEMADNKYGLSAKDQSLTKDFYGNK